ncbi:MAG: hypothetical protein MUE77_03965 [Sandarakinorhabdus sp.]|nr:hypothetical protein [Sandarakinorhabdus sp.]
MNAASSSASPAAPPALPRPILSLGVTGHRENNPAFAANRDAVEATIAAVFDRVAALADRAVAARADSVAGPAPIRLNCLLADGSDQMAVAAALARGWQVVAPLPFGLGLNVAINARPSTAIEARLLAAGGVPTDTALAERAAAIRRQAAAAHLFALADADDRVAPLFHAMLDAPGDAAAIQRFTALLSQRVALAGRVLVEQSDIVIGIWDGQSRDALGGTGHTIATALQAGAMVVQIDPACPEDWQVLRSLEALGGGSSGDAREQALAAAISSALDPGGDGGAAALAASQWRDASSPLFHHYRRVEALFGGDADPWRSLQQRYEPPGAVASGSGAPTLKALAALPDGDRDYPDRVARTVLERQAWTDGIATRLSDLYRGGMVGNFIASGLAVVVGMAYLPLKLDGQKWLFATVEFALLAAILGVIALGRRGHWHDRWFETRRAAEYLRHAPVLMALGAGRPPGRWPRAFGPGAAPAAGALWPEHHARHAVREAGLPRVTVTRAYLQAVLEGLLDRHVIAQRDYHRAKAARLQRVHHRLEKLSSLLFLLAFLSVALWLLIAGGAALGWLPAAWPGALAKPFTFLGVFFPTFGGAVAGIHYFGDFDRFGAISQVSAERLDVIHRRAQLLLARPASLLEYGEVADLAHAADAAVIAEIESWQAVFAGKHFTVPV